MIASRSNRADGSAANPAVDSIRILLLDRSRLSADALGRRLIAEDDVSGVRTAASAAEALRALSEESFTVMVATADLARELRAAPTERAVASADVPIVILADADTEQQAPELFRAGGIAGWVSRYRSSDALMDAIRTCLRGDACLPRNVLARLAEQSPPADTSRSARDRVLATLTEREVEILLLLEQGLGRYDIATRLHLSPNTVRTHIQRILRRLNVHSTLAALALLRAG